MSYDSSNIFARILRGEIPAHVVEETEHTLTFMDIMPRAPGHTLVIPKEGSENLFETSDEILAHVMKQVRRVARAIKFAYPDQGVRIVQLNGSNAGQTVFHLHFHIIPSSAGSDFSFHGTAASDDQSLAESANLIRQSLVQVN